MRGIVCTDGGYGSSWGRNGDFCITVGLVTNIDDIVVKDAGC